MKICVQFLVGMLLPITVVNGLVTCKTNSTLCVKEVTSSVNVDLSLSCIANGHEKQGQWMYCGPKGGGIHFSMKWLKDGFPIEVQTARYVLENDNQTLTLLNTSQSDSGRYQCNLTVHGIRERFRKDWCRNFNNKNYYFYRPFIFTEYPNITVTQNMFSNKSQHLNATFMVNVTDIGPISSEWEMASIYFSRSEVSPWVNLRLRPDQGFRTYDIMDLTNMLISVSFELEELSNAYQEVVVTANLSDSVSFDCPVRTAIPLTQEVYWMLEYQPYFWEETKLYMYERFPFDNETTHIYNLTDPESRQTCLFCNVTQRRWTLFVHKLTEEWDHSNLTCYIHNPWGTARIVYKLEILGVIPVEQEKAPSLFYPLWCQVSGFALGQQCGDNHHKTQAIAIRPQSSPNIELSIDVWVQPFDRAKVTLNVVPRHCRSMDFNRPYHNCSEVMHWAEAEGFQYQQEVFSWDVWLGYPERDHMTPEHEGYLWFWDAYNYAIGDSKKTKPVYFWVEEEKPPTTAAAIPVTKLSKKKKKPQKDRKQQKVAKVENTQSRGHLVWLSLGVSLSVFFVFFWILLIVLCRKKWKISTCSKRTPRRIRKIVRISDMQMNTLYLSRGSENSEAPTEPALLPEITIETFGDLDSTTNLVSMCNYEIPQDPNWEISRSKVVLGSVLGEGAFGLVKKATVKDLLVSGCATPVAVKMLKDNSTDADLKSLLTELHVMKYIGKPGHPNVIQLLGSCTNSGPVYVILEYVAHGNLKDYLRESASILKRTKLLLSIGHPYPDDTVTVRTLLYFARQVSSGMEYIASLKIVHRDLAARNVLVADNHMLKITDFGFTRLLQDAEYYRTQNNGRFPVKWMAPEAISDNRCTSKSDVWSFGVLLWELFSLGGNPYPNVPFEVMLEHLQKGLRMSRPVNCPDLLYSLMLTCWAHSASKRPSFSHLHTFLEHIHEKQTQDGLPVLPELDREEMKWYYIGSFARASASSSLPYLGSSADQDSALVLSHDDLTPQPLPKLKLGGSDAGSGVETDTPVPLTPPYGQVFNILHSGEAVCDHKVSTYPVLNLMTFSQSVENLENSVFEDATESPTDGLPNGRVFSVNSPQKMGEYPVSGNNKRRESPAHNKTGDSPVSNLHRGWESPVQSLNRGWKSPVKSRHESPESPIPHNHNNNNKWFNGHGGRGEGVYHVDMESDDFSSLQQQDTGYGSPQTEQSSICSINIPQHKVRFSPASFSPSGDESRATSHSKDYDSPKKGIIRVSALSPKSTSTHLSPQDGYPYLHYPKVNDRQKTTTISPCVSPSKGLKVLKQALAPDSLSRIGKISPREVGRKILSGLKPQSAPETMHSVSSPNIATTIMDPMSSEDEYICHSLETAQDYLVARATKEPRVSTDSYTPLLYMSDTGGSDAAWY